MHLSPPGPSLFLTRKHIPPQNDLLSFTHSAGGALRMEIAHKMSYIKKSMKWHNHNSMEARALHTEQANLRQLHTPHTCALPINDNHNISTASTFSIINSHNKASL